MSTQEKKVSNTRIGDDSMGLIFYWWMRQVEVCGRKRNYRMKIAISGQLYESDRPIVAMKLRGARRQMRVEIQNHKTLTECQELGLVNFVQG